MCANELLRGRVCCMSNPDVFDLVQESVIVRDLEGRITQWNAASRRLYGWTRSEAVGRITHELLMTGGEPASVTATSSAGPPTARSWR